jgi:class 3 adenylate cyclase
MPPAPPNWQPVTEPRLVFRFLKRPDPAADDFADNFKSDGEANKRLHDDEHPDVLTGMSVFNSEEAARKRFAAVRDDVLRKRSDTNRRRNRPPPPIRIGEHIGEVLLTAGQGFEIADDDDPEGHLTLRGDKDQLAARVARIYPAGRDPT